MAKRLVPLLNRVLVERIVPPSKTATGILLPEKSAKLNSGKVVAVGPGTRNKEGQFIPATVKEGDTVLLPEYGGTEVKLGDKEYLIRFTAGPLNLSLGYISKCQVSSVSLLKASVLPTWPLLGCLFHRYHLYRDEDILGTLHD
ncbi:unnamed protein product [Malus baccata var. baccata]